MYLAVRPLKGSRGIPAKGILLRWLNKSVLATRCWELQITLTPGEVIRSFCGRQELLYMELKCCWGVYIFQMKSFQPTVTLLSSLMSVALPKVAFLQNWLIKKRPLIEGADPAIHIRRICIRKMADGNSLGLVSVREHSLEAGGLCHIHGAYRDMLHTAPGHAPC